MKKKGFADSFKTAAKLLFLIAILTSCTNQNEEQLPVDFVWDRAACEQCRMAISDNRYAALKGGKTTVINESGDKIMQLSADSVKAIGDRLLQIWSGGKTGLISTEGDRLTETKYAYLNHIDSKILASSIWIAEPGLDAKP